MVPEEEPPREPEPAGSVFFGSGKSDGHPGGRSPLSDTETSPAGVEIEKPSLDLEVDTDDRSVEAEVEVESLEHAPSPVAARVAMRMAVATLRMKLLDRGGQILGSNLQMRLGGGIAQMG
ncbi:MAG: hypothetical protein IPF88_00220 [Candidatus Microthrix sp.]|jgi:hypothetical protein|uniref:Uncharacterized protein n=1 Tax=Candidatus Neomicrothrix subdominans TaxID=2954438 RepID=A0A936THC6_9ACTN|nr:hypothetical protein [Candidatus Microthrix sp.]MBK6312312.1 hypothetical protein [Candidatus Microthrix sp.]MBK6437048.1 hypothetical protein [Candidatus Microthrix sp.]MBK6969326.1 hypothetical protein [Candidatus Microthrix sp.]MBK9298695.1 hypothetical protein [Candidatus Microthrix subdominans]